MREAEGKLRHQHCKNQNGRERERERERGRRLRTVLALPSRSLHLEAGPSIGCSQGHGVWHDGGRSPQPARVSRARSGARWRQEPATGTRGARRRQEPAAGTAALGTRSGRQEGTGNREQGGDAILNQRRWMDRARACFRRRGGGEGELGRQEA